MRISLVVDRLRHEIVKFKPNFDEVYSMIDLKKQRVDWVPPTSL